MPATGRGVPGVRRLGLFPLLLLHPLWEGSAMTLQELSKYYEQSAVLLRKRLRLLRQLLATETDPEEIFHLKRRIRELSPMLTEMNELAE